MVGLDGRPGPCVAPARRGVRLAGAYGARVRAMFTSYVLLIVAGLAFYTIVGLTHH